MVVKQLSGSSGLRIIHIKSPIFAGNCKMGTIYRRMEGLTSTCARWMRMHFLSLKPLCKQWIRTWAKTTRIKYFKGYNQLSRDAGVPFSVENIGWSVSSLKKEGMWLRWRSFEKKDTRYKAQGTRKIQGTRQNQGTSTRHKAQGRFKAQDARKVRPF